MSVAGILFGLFAVLLICNIPASNAISNRISSMSTVIIAADLSYGDDTNKRIFFIEQVFIASDTVFNCGNIMEQAGAIRKTYNFAKTMVGHRRTGLAMVCVDPMSAAFCGYPGSGPGFIAALGMIMVYLQWLTPGYTNTYSASLMSAGRR